MFAPVFRSLRRLHRPAWLGLAALLPVLLFSGLFWYEVASDSAWENVLRSGELKVGNFLRKHGRGTTLRSDLVFLGIDEATLQLDGLWPEEIEGSPALKLITASKGDWNWSREVHALILERLVSAGAKLVIFDMIFPNPFQGDDAFRAALDKHRQRVVIGNQIVHRPPPAPGLPAPGDAWQPPSAMLIADAARDSRVGYVVYQQDIDGAIRTTLFHTTLSAYNGRVPQPGEPVYYSEMASALRQLGRADLVPASPEPQIFRYTDLSHGEDYRVRPLWEIFSDATWKQNYQDGAFFKDKIVIVGAAAPILHDVQPTPFGDIPGPVLQLQALTAALNQDYLTLTGVWTDFALIFAAGALAWGVAITVLQPLVRFSVFALVSAAFIGVLQWLYNHHGLMPLAFTPLLVFNTSGLLSVVGDYAVERVEKARVRGVLDRLVSKDIVRELLADPARYGALVRGERRCVTVLFSDVRGFTSLTEAAEDPAEFIAQLNEYLGEMVDVVFKHRGTLDKFIGDAVMAVWGSMHTDGLDADARAAVAAALEMRTRLAALNTRWLKAGKLPMDIGIGVNHGEVIVGGLGSESSKMEITVMGDAVNLASRLEGLTKEYGLDLLVGESVARRVSETFRLRTVDLVRVKGKKKPAEVMTVIGPLTEVPSESQELLFADYEDAILLYRKQEFAAAVRLLEECTKHNPADILTAFYLERCQALIADAPAPGWDGVRLMKTK